MKYKFDNRSLVLESQTDEEATLLSFLSGMDTHTGTASLTSKHGIVTRTLSIMFSNKDLNSKAQKLLGVDYETFKEFFVLGVEAFNDRDMTNEDHIKDIESTCRYIFEYYLDTLENKDKTK